MKKTAILPGGFKPPHKGHYELALDLAKQSGAEVTIRVGPSERDGITQAMSIEIWELYGFKAVAAASGNPVVDVFKYVENEAEEGETVYVGTGWKDYPRFTALEDPNHKNYSKYNPKGITVDEKEITSKGGGISGNKMREFIMNDQKDLFQNNLPDHVDKNKIWNIVLDNIQEDLYDPNDHVLDYMKSSEWKAGMPDGPKDDIEPGYKYRRGGQYSAASGIGGAGGMYESRGGESELHIYDFDETIARVETPIPYTVESPEGKIIEKGETTSIDFEEKKDFLKNSYDKGIKINWDFKAFANLISKGTLNNEVFQKLLKSIQNPNAKVTILTARAIGLPVTKFLKDQGIWAYVVPLGLNKEKGQPVTGEDKANWIENRIKDTTKKVLFIDDSSENRKAIYTLRDKYPNIEFDVENPLEIEEMMGTMNNQEKAKHAKNLKRLSKDMSNMKGNNYGGGGYKVPKYIKGTLTRKLYEEMSAADIDAVDTFADKQLNPVDVVLTDKHFFDRLNDPRNKKEISGAELIGFFKRLARKKDEFVEFLTKYKELVVTDNRTNLNIPFMKLANKAIAKTVMRKKDFQTSSPKLSVGEANGWDGASSKHPGNWDGKPSEKIKNKPFPAVGETVRAKKMEETKLFSQNWWKEQLTEILTETKANTHLTHLEELVLTQGQDGYNQAKSFLYELIKNLKGEDNNIKNVSVKWDGAPAVWAGINPENGKFFVGIKGIFNTVTPKINYTPQDIDKNHGHSGDLVKKLKLALQYLPALGIKNILQGDFMFDSNDVQTDNIDGVTHYTFRPNTIRYAIEANSEIGKKILNAKIGVIWHTTYNSLEQRDFSFGADVSGLSQTPDVWFDDAYFKDDTGVLLSSKEEAFVLEKIKEADSINVDYDALPDELSSRAKTNMLNTYLNQEIRKGEFINDPNKSFERFKSWYQLAVDKSIEKVKRPESKERKKTEGEEKLKIFDSKKEIVLNLFKVSKLLSEAKAIFITKYDKAVATKHFIDNGDGTLSVTKAEGFVAVDHTENGIKLVDRLEFSKNNFNAGKPGAKK